MNVYLGILFAIIVGSCIALQPVLNAGSSKFVGNFEAAMVSITVTFITITLVTLLWGKGDFSKLSEVPKYCFFAGVLGAGIVICSMLSVKLLGAAVAISIFVTTQKLISLISDHYGWFGSTAIPIDLSRVIGLVFMLLGVKLLMK